jgi:2-polyprenyl-3-methyl-5-hydroxy-6-metoxy-1,4-benzoquinol methylase
MLRTTALGLHYASRAAAYMAAGALDLATLRGEITSRWSNFLPDEPSIRAGLETWERQFYDRFLEGRHRVLLVGAGSGRDLLAFLRAGHTVDAVELSPHTAAIARRIVAESGFDTAIHVAAIEEWTPPGRYDAIVFSWYCYSYIPARRRRIGVLAALREHLTPHGVILISYLLRRTSTPRGMPITAWLSRLTRSDWGPETGDDMVGLMDQSLIQFEHYFTPEEIEAEAEAAGLRVAWHKKDRETALVLEATS